MSDLRDMCPDCQRPYSDHSHGGEGENAYPVCPPDLRDELAEAIYGALSGSFGDFGGNHSRRAANAILPIIERETTRARAEGFADPPAVSTKAIRAWMDRVADYPTSTGQVGWVANRDELVAILAECTPGVPLSVIPEQDPTDSDMVTFYVRLSVSFSREELDELDAGPLSGPMFGDGGAA